MSSSWFPPPEIAEFRMERRLGRGATADVWLARDTLLDRVVALKIARSAASVETRARFRVEARAVAKMQHPNLLAIHHVGEVNDRPFLVTEFLSGRTLDDLERPIDPERVLTIGIDLARGLAAAHHAGVLHRDIKPANAMLCDDGVVKLLDFGLAKLDDAPVPLLADPPRGLVAVPVDAVHHMTLPMSADTDVAGTPLYMAPETWLGEPATRRSDVYSLGALLFELLSGMPPCIAGLPAGLELTLAEMGARVLMGQLGDLTELAPSAPRALVDLVQRCLSTQPGARPTADEACDALVRVAAQRAALTEAPDDLGANPYRGLLAFGPEHRALFFGRDAESAAIVAELRVSPFVLVVGPSGAGKSSLVRAGVVPRIEKGVLAPGAAWRAITLVPGRRPTDALAQAFAPVLQLSEARLDEQLETSARTWLADELRASGARLLLVIDQLEEIWTMAPAEERRAFFEIVAALSLSAPGVRVVATLRADFLGRLEDMGELQAQALRAVIVLRPMAPEGLRRAIVEPARRRGVVIEPALVEHLVARTEGEALPLLEFALGALYARRGAEASAIGLSDLQALGGVEGALATHADATLARLPRAQRREARRLLLGLVTVERTRSRREEGDLLGQGGADARATLDALVDARLVVAGAGEHGAAYEVAHEALLSGWPTLRGWLDEEATAREATARLALAAGEWVRLGRGEEGLGSERLLQDLAIPGALAGATDDALAFVEASRAAIARARRRRQALRFGVPIAAMVLAAAFGGGTRWSERRQARAFVAARVAEADVALRSAAALDAETEGARGEAFARYDAGDRVGGEARWQDARALAVRESESFAAASEPLGLALARDPLDPGARARAADLALRWLLAAERDHEEDVVRDLSARLAQVDDDGSRRARLAAPAHVQVTTAPPGASVVLHGVRVEGDGRRIEDEGRPVEAGAIVELAPGSYVLEASAPGRYRTRYPLLLARGQEERVEIPLPSLPSVPQGFVFVPAGVSLVGATDVEAVRATMGAEPEHAVRVGAFLIGEREVTYAEYLEFLASLAPAERAARRPHALEDELTYDRAGVPSVALGAARARRGDPLCRPKRSVRRCQDWLRFPVTGIAWEDARAYASFLAGRGVPGARLCTEREWERAARGADGRLFPHGDVLRPGDANFDATYGGEADQMGADEVGSFPVDRSPLGALDLAGSVAEWVGSEHVARGGRWFYASLLARAASRFDRQDDRDSNVGLRICGTLAGTP